MKKLTLEDCNKRTIGDLFLAAVPAFSLNKTYCTVVLKIDGKIFNVGGVNYDPETMTIDHLEPFGNYYKEGEYRFVMHNGRPVVDVDNLGPAEEFLNKYFESAF